MIAVKTAVDILNITVTTLQWKDTVVEVQGKNAHTLIHINKVLVV